MGFSEVPTSSKLVDWRHRIANIDTKKKKKTPTTATVEMDKTYFSLRKDTHMSENYDF